MDIWKTTTTIVGEFYREEAAKLLGEASISQYMEKVIQRIEAEDVR